MVLLKMARNTNDNDFQGQFGLTVDYSAEKKNMNNSMDTWMSHYLLY